MVLTNALWITLIGMGLVFLSILLLWGLMALLVRVLAEPVKPTRAAEPVPAELGQSSIPEHSLLISRKRRAAAAAVAAALALEQDTRKLPQPGRAPQTSGVSVWQAVNRAGQIGQRGNSPRKKVVR
jgi:Na+-transporting methylmalonyl-CoA/oxaloacetate decarboxylase gamma subunit